MPSPRSCPRSPAITYLNGSLYEAAGDRVAALRCYRETSALREGHERALLGQTVCLTSLKETDQAIQVATHLIDATHCHDGSARDAERQLRSAVDRADWEPDFKALRINALEARVTEQRAQESTAAVNAAANSLRAGDLGQAQSYVDRAARDPDRAAAVNELRGLIEALRRRPYSQLPDPVDRARVAH